MNDLSAKEYLEMYRNYLYALREREEYGDRYGDTEEIIEMYEEKLKIKKIGEKRSDKKC